MMVRFSSQIVLFLLWFLCGAKFGLSLSRSNSKIRCNGRDREVLLQFKKGVVDPSRLLSSWSNEEDCCKWSGVQCHNITGRVTELNLNYIFIRQNYDSEELTGEINLCVLQLEFLNYLDLSWNNFTAIHDSTDERLRYHNLSQLTPQHPNTNTSSQLFYLDLSRNYFLEIDNVRWLSHIPSLKYLNLTWIDLHRETNWLHSMTTMLPSLLELRLQECQLDSVRPSLTYVNFTSLTVLDLSFNNFHSKVPELVFNLSNCLSYLDLSENYFDGIFDTLSHLQNLKYLFLSGNNLNGTILKWLAQHKNLQVLDLSYNSLHGSIPPVLGNLSSLTHLDVSHNHLNGNIPESLQKLSSLESLKIGGNYLAGVLSESNFTNFTNLKVLDLSSSAFLFNFSSDWIPPFQLEEIVLRSSILGPIFPAWLYTQRFLNTLDISSSGISFVNHDKFWNFVSNITERLDIYNNSFSGDISNLVLNTRLIDLTSNKFIGGLPRITPNVSGFLAQNNSFSGPISPLLCGTGNAEQNDLSFLALSDNLLSGQLPDCWMNWKYLANIKLGSNNLTGRIPQSMGSLSSLEVLLLYDNNLFGHIPLSLQHCNKLEILDLGGNQFSGSIPSWLTQSIIAIQLRGNQFSGSIPPQICQFSTLILLDLADNRLSGSIPQCLYNLTAMKNISTLSYSYTLLDTPNELWVPFRFHTKGLELESEFSRLYPWVLIDLSKNNLVGSIPPELFYLVELISLNLSQNHLTGKIPAEIGQMKNLESLDFSMNKLFGEIPQVISSLSFLGYLNLSFNNLTGKIPIGTQLQGFNASCYIGNLELCGAPLKNCTQCKESVDIVIAKDEDEDEFFSWFYLGMGVGFATSFWGVCAALFFNRAWRHAYFRFLADIKDRFYLKVFLIMNSIH